ncbi:MAG: hypothetical protein JSW50_02100, partial [Candidatus Latescibacterota bacterium]
MADSRSPEEPPRARSFYPLTLGNQWTYETRFEITITDVDKTTAGSTQIFEAVEDRSLNGLENRYGRIYVIESSQAFADGRPDTIRSWIRYRQDHAGLYVANVSILEPPRDSADNDGPAAIHVQPEYGAVDAGITVWPWCGAW